jgi:LruC domain-containing protein
LPTEVNNFNIGRWGDLNPDSYFDGVIDEVRLWSTARSLSQIQSYRTRSIPSPYTGMVGYWPMEEGSGATTGNIQGNALLDGTLSSPDWIGDIDSDGDGAPNMVGGVQFDDYPHDPVRAFNNYWPANYYTLAFEDLWPSIADFDLNDAVIAYRFNNITNASNFLVETYGNFTLKASGGSLQKGFAFQLPNTGILNSDFSVSAPGNQRTKSYITYNANGTEAGQDKIVIIVDDELPYNGNTVSGKHWNEVSFWVRMNMVAPYNKSVDYFDIDTWNPFLIVFKESDGIDRRREVHLAGYTPTKIAFDWVAPQRMYFDSANDGSNYPTGGIDGKLWYKTNLKTTMWGVNFGQYFPYGLDIPKNNFQWAIEADLTHVPAVPPDPDYGTYRFTLKYAYDYFDDWASSNGTTNLDWYDHITNAEFIYTP